MRFPALFRPVRGLFLCAVVLLTADTGLRIPDAVAAKTPETAAEYYDHAVELIAEGDPRGAVIQLKNALQKDPKDLSARILLGRTYVDLNDGKSAEEQLLRARREGARDSFVILPLGRAYLLQGKFDKVIKEITSVGQDQKTATEITLLRGDAQLAVRDYRSAEASYLEASKIRPEDARPLVGLARVKLALDDLNGARLYTKWAIEADSKDPTAWYFQGDIAERRGKIDEALESYGKAIELAPKFVKALLARAAIRLDRSLFDLAEPDLQKVREHDPRNPRAAYLMSLILAHRGEVGEAQKLLAEAEAILKEYPAPYLMAHPPSVLLAGVVTYYRKDLDSSYRLLSYFLRQSPHHAGARKLLASIALTRNEPATAIKFLDGLAPRQSDDVEVLTMYGDALARLKRYHEANRVLKRAGEVARPGSSALFRLVTVRLGAGMNSEAIRLLKTEIDRNPDAIQAMIMLGTAQMRAGDYSAALETLNSVTDRQPDNAVAQNLAGGALVGLGRMKDARDRYQAAVDAAPDYVSALANLAKVEGRLGNLESASRLFNEVLEKDQRNGKAMIALSDIARQRNDLSEAFRWLEKARSASREADLAALRLVDLYIEASRADTAVQVARQLYDRGPSQFENILALGRAQLAAKRLEDAVATFGMFATLAEERKSAARLNQAATWQMQARDIRGAHDSLRKALELDPDYLPTHLKLFTLELTAGSLDPALGRARKVAMLNPASPTGHQLQGDVYMRMRRFGEAVEAYDKALQIRSSAALMERAYRARRAAGADGLSFVRSWAEDRMDDPIARRMLATAYADSGRPADALKIYEVLLKAAPENISILNNIALLYERMGDDRALTFAKRAYDAAPGEPVTMDTYGWVLVRRGKIDEGTALLRNARLKAPDVREIRYHLAVALNMSGKRDEAIAELRAALADDLPFDGDAEARALLARLSSRVQ